MTRDVCSHECLMSNQDVSAKVTIREAFDLKATQGNSSRLIMENLFAPFNKEALMLLHSCSCSFRLACKGIGFLNLKDFTLGLNSMTVPLLTGDFALDE